MSKLIIAYGPAGSGKSAAAREWLSQNPRNRIVVDEGSLNPVFMKEHVEFALRVGIDVWMNLIMNNAAILDASIEGHEVEMRKFGLDYELVE